MFTLRKNKQMQEIFSRRGIIIDDRERHTICPLKLKGISESILEYFRINPNNDNTIKKTMEYLNSKELDEIKFGTFLLRRFFCELVDIDTSFPSSPSDTHVPSTKLVKDNLDAKISKSSTSGLVKNDGTVDTKTYQELLSSGVNIKTINNNSLLGSGNITIQGGGGSVIGTGSFSIDNNGHLIVELPDAVDNPYYINSNGHLIYDTSNTHNGE